MARVLIVDDETPVRKGLHRVLEVGGHEVWEASRAALALDVLDTQPMDLVITDLYMPDMDGIEFITHLVRRNRGWRVIAMTGGGERSPGDILSAAAAAGAERLLAKPFTSDQLAEAVEAVLATRGDVRLAAQAVAVTARTTGAWLPTVQDLAGH